ncbi:MAG TPA: exonuclease domain-containing protein [Tepidisphaeraceae bacterium]|jgi:DNA polymerase-3 subunit epsilon|nr:exonuclease domain-containing protein [Tepidisphaeraceae bacterium]
MSFSLLQKLCDIPLVFIDVETTGATAEFGDRIIEVGIVRIEGCKRVAEYAQLVDPQRRISPGVCVLTGISQAMVTGQPTFQQILPQVLKLMRGAAVLGHNVRFDLSFLNKEFRRAGMEMEGAFENPPVFDTVRIARMRFGRGGNGLQRLAPRLGIQPVAAHRALADAQTTHLVFEKLIEPVGGWQICIADTIREQGGPIHLLPESRESLLPLALEEALDQSLPVMMEYIDAKQNRTNRVVRPLKIHRRNGEMILIAHCELRNGERTFKIARIVRLERVGAVAEGIIDAMLPGDLFNSPKTGAL